MKYADKAGAVSSEREVAPYAGAGIEIFLLLSQCRKALRRPLRGGGN